MLAIGLALSFGVMRLVNLAHGEFLVIGAYLSAAILQVLKFPPFFVLIIVVPIMFVIGYALQRLLLNRVSIQAMERRGMSSNFGLMAPILVTLASPSRIFCSVSSPRMQRRYLMLLPSPQSTLPTI
jgi:branched-chain amino acid transport system permease protein